MQLFPTWFFLIYCEKHAPYVHLLSQPPKASANKKKIYIKKSCSPSIASSGQLFQSSTHLFLFIFVLACESNFEISNLVSRRRTFLDDGARADYRERILVYFDAAAATGGAFAAAGCNSYVLSELARSASPLTASLYTCPGHSMSSGLLIFESLTSLWLSISSFLCALVDSRPTALPRARRDVTNYKKHEEKEG